MEPLRRSTQETKPNPKYESNEVKEPSSYEAASQNDEWNQT